MYDTPFKLNQIKLSHYHFDNGFYTKGTPILTTLEIKKIDDNNLEKIVTHKYIKDETDLIKDTNSYSETINSLKLLEDLETIDLRHLKNNYKTEEGIETLSHYEIEYNYDNKIVGTYDNEIDEFKDLSDILGFKELVRDEILKARNSLK